MLYNIDLFLRKSQKWEIPKRPSICSCPSSQLNSNPLQSKAGWNHNGKYNWFFQFETLISPVLDKNLLYFTVMAAV